jgi:HD-like signal output (HDOD) protein
VTAMIEQPLENLDAWISYFGSAELPVLRHTMHELDQLRENADKVNARVLAGIILHDPLMTLRVLAYIEKHRQKRQTTDIATIERALMMIGIDPFFRDFQNLPLVEEQLKAYPKALVGVLKVMGRARKAAHWARDWAIIRHDLDVDEITVATLLYDSAELLMWCFAPALALKVRDAQISNRNRRSVEIQTEMYGIPLFELKSGLAKAWHLPALILMLLDSENAENPRVRNVKLAVDLARHSVNGWDDAALPDDFTAIEELIHLPHETLMHKLGIDKDPEVLARFMPPPATEPTQPQ